MSLLELYTLPEFWYSILCWFCKDLCIDLLFQPEFGIFHLDLWYGIIMLYVRVTSVLTALQYTNLYDILLYWCIYFQIMFLVLKEIHWIVQIPSSFRSKNTTTSFLREVHILSEILFFYFVIQRNCYIYIRFYYQLLQFNFYEWLLKLC